MANGSSSAQGLSFPRETFAKLTPGPFLHAHLKQQNPVRPTGRAPEESRKPTVNTGSLTHSNGSAVVRVGDTAVVCGVRAEILLASNVTNPPSEGTTEDEVVAELGLLVPNIELSTGCSPAHLPGNAPGTLAQSLSYRMLSLLNTSNPIGLDDLRIQYEEPSTEDDPVDAGPKVVTKAYWTLYIDILCIALDGNPFDAAWAAVIAALQSTVLPKAWWDPDCEMVLCSPLTADARKVQLRGLPIASTFAVFSTASPLKQREDAEDWVLADPDGFEADVCRESLTVVVTSQRGERSSLLKVEKSGGAVVGREKMRRCVTLAEARWEEWDAILRGG